MILCQVFTPVLLGLNQEMWKHHLASDGYKVPLQVMHYFFYIYYFFHLLHC